MTNKFSICIVNWNTGDLLARCINSLVELPEKERALIDEVVVVDNLSSDNSMVQARVVVGKSINKPRVRFIQLDNNIGFAAGNNLALEKILHRNGVWPHVLLLNPDTEVKAGLFDAALEIYGRDNQVGIVGPRLLNSDGTVQPSVRSFPKFINFVWYFLKLNKLLASAPSWKSYMREDLNYDLEASVEQVMGAALFVRDAVLKEVGVLDDDFFLWFEEVDYCLRVDAAGWKIKYSPRGEVIHHGGVSFNQLGGWTKSLRWIRSCLTYAHKNLPRWQWLSLSVIGLISLGSIVPVAAILVRWQPRNEN